MPFAHEKLDVYILALDFIALADQLVENLPRGRGHLADQLGRASTSIVLNLAEGAGKFSKPDKRRYYLIAVGSTTECAALLDVCLRLKLVPTEPHSIGKAMLERIAAMLVKLCKGPRRVTGAGAGRQDHDTRVLVSFFQSLHPHAPPLRNDIPSHLAATNLVQGRRSTTARNQKRRLAAGSQSPATLFEFESDFCFAEIELHGF